MGVELRGGALNRAPKGSLQCFAPDHDLPDGLMASTLRGADGGHPCSVASLPGFSRGEPGTCPPLTRHMFQGTCRACPCSALPFGSLICWKNNHAPYFTSKMMRIAGKGFPCGYLNHPKMSRSMVLVKPQLITSFTG
jgi:hypothetical protein